ncbi:hypothetical protein [Listeria newyorkensis]|uniref:hypothetical protein n=1 Tax=Listeria newyorkensis TaxID=1497681 RepID=UPI00051D9018|nr:hypothetical protein [Listeria newyorkensis]KGL43597.1 hypothetical protein EP58_07610 [Listeria newyorkensis]
MKYKNKEAHICFSRHKNEALRIDIVSGALERLETCTIETDAYRKYLDQDGLSEDENRKIRVRHLLNLIAGLDLKKTKAIAFLQENGILETGMAYRETVNGRDVGYYYLTEEAIDQKGDIVDEDARYDDFFSWQVRQYFKLVKENKGDIESTKTRLDIENRIQATGFPLHYLKEGKKEQVVKKFLYFRKRVR